MPGVPGAPGLNPGRHWLSLPSAFPAGGAGGRSPACLAAVVPAGGLPALPSAYPAFGLPFCPLSPRPPSPAGKGETYSFLMQGASPLASLGLNPGGTGSTCRLRSRRGAQGGGRLPALPLWCPAGGRGACPRAALARPAPGERTISNAEVPLPRSPLSLAAGTANRMAVLSVLRRTGDAEGKPLSNAGLAGRASVAGASPSLGTCLASSVSAANGLMQGCRGQAPGEIN